MWFEVARPQSLADHQQQIFVRHAFSLAPRGQQPRHAAAQPDDRSEDLYEEVERFRDRPGQTPRVDDADGLGDDFRHQQDRQCEEGREIADPDRAEDVGGDRPGQRGAAGVGDRVQRENRRDRPIDMGPQGSQDRPAGTSRPLERVDLRERHRVQHRLEERAGARSQHDEPHDNEQVQHVSAQTIWAFRGTGETRCRCSG